MASWKLIGVVPDSEDEDDLDLETQNNANNANVHENEPNDNLDFGENGEGGVVAGINGTQLDLDEVPANANESNEYEKHEEKEEKGKEENSGIICGNSNDGNTCTRPLIPSGNCEVGEEDGGGLSEDELAIPPKRQPAREQPAALYNGGAPASSPFQPMIFRVPPLEDDEIPLPVGFQTMSQLSRDIPGKNTPAEDEISTSYVRISTPHSSPLSSPPGSQGSKSRTEDTQRSLMSIDLQNGSESLSDRAAREAAMEELVNSRRSFRQRNPIQLHPYMLEQEKYRQTLKDRGVRPMRITQTQEEKESNSRNSSSPAPESQNMEVDAGASQPMDFDWDPPSSPPERIIPEKPNRTVREASPLPTDSTVDDGSIASDDEFPDVNELLLKPRATLNTIESRRRLKKYSLKHRTKSTLVRPTHAYHNDSSIFDIPVSPPVTSPLLGNNSRNAISQSMSLSSAKEVAPNSSGLEHHFRVPAGIQTPVTSAIKPPSKSILVSLDLDEDDPFASDHDTSSTAESSSEESIEMIRKVSKKIRGVLPASHLRLNHDSKRPEISSAIQRHNIDTASTTPQMRRGVAIPRTSATTTRRNSESLEITVLSDSDGESDTYLGGFVAEDDAPTALDMLFNDRQGFAEEENSIDRMLPTQKRKARPLNGQPGKKRRTGLETSSRIGMDQNTRQPKITEHLGGVPQWKRKQGNSKSLSVFSTKSKSQSKRTRTVAPRLSILDAVDYNATNKQLPQFVRIAARTARSRKGQGRHSPTKKFIKMSNRDDTLEAQKVLQDWRNGRIQPKHREHQRSNSNDLARRALQPIVVNKQTKLPPPTKKVNQGTPTTSARGSQAPRRLFVTKPRQTSIGGFVTPGEPVPISENPQAQPNSPKKARLHQSRPRSNISNIRPAQLESSDAERHTQDSGSFFKTSKRSLDVIFRDLRRRHGAQANPQLGRYLANESIRPTVETNGKGSPTIFTEKAPLPVFRRKKNQPTRVDVDAAKYRQPSEPIVLERFPKQIMTDKNDKLQGLGKFGTRYPIHFDILPLNTAVYFHESSFIGSGRLSEVINGVRILNCTDGVRNSFILDGKTFRWDQWNENVSSEIGVCFDWMIEQACSLQPSLSNVDPVSAITFISGYIQHHVVFRLPHDQVNFLSRMSEIFADISSRLDVIDGKTACEQWIEISSRCTVVVYQLLQMARKMPEGETLSYDFEDLLKRVARTAVRLLVADGLDNIRRLYDDLQYLSFREMGLKNKQFAIQGWVVLIKVLDSSRISRGTFWDIVNLELGDPGIHEASDVPTFENWWYSIFTLLPLFGFDELGIVKSELRNHSSDNWSLLQKLLKRVFELYKLNSHQPPGFNDYCRANLARCHYLMVEWGWWKCSGLIGTIFDFFADQKLANLRNEEVYDSPRFLRQLDAEPSLDLQPEDLCFHILLKIVGLALKRMGQLGDAKSVRNLVTRLLPNHNREFPKEESIHHRELASLRNHHDLLCTLYWAAPSQQRPSPVLIRDLVVADRSHKEACLINLRAWGNLTRVVVSEPVNIPAYQPFINWQNALCTALAKQYLDTEVEIRAQAESASESEKATMIIAINKKSTMETLRVIVKVMGHTVNAAKSAQMATLAFNPAVLCALCSQEICEDNVFPEGLISDSVAVICQYLAQIDNLEPIVSPVDRSGIDGEGESQESDTMSFILCRWEMIHRLQPEIVPWLRTIITKGLQESSKMTSQLLSNAIICWARLITKMTEGIMRMKEFVTTGASSIFQYRHSSRKAMAYWPVLIGELVEHKHLDELSMPGFDIGAQWLLSITMPSSIIALSFGAVDMLTARLRSKGHYLLTGNSSFASSSIAGTLSAGSRMPDNHTLFKSAVDIMRTTLSKQSNVDLIFDNVSLKEAHTKFASILKQVMESMKTQLESMTSGSKEHSEYVEFVQRIASIIRSYASDIQPLMDFFMQSSIHYWPEDTDPNMYAAGVVSYSLRLAKNPSITSPQLLHYLYNGWRKDIVQGRIKQHMNHVKNGMKHWEFTEFMLLEFIPAALHVGFRWAGGWAVCATYLPLLSNQLTKILQEESENAHVASEHLINLLNDIINELSLLQRRVDDESITLANHLYIAHTVFQFWFSIALPIKVFKSSLSDASKSVDDIESSMMKILSRACRTQDCEPIENLEIPVARQTMRGAQFDRFVSVFTQDLSEHWEVANNGYEVEIGSIRAREASKTRVDLRYLLGECLTLKQLLGRSLMVMPFLRDVPGVEVPVEKMKGPMVGDIYF
ncbi:hypothetical protein HYFRA_00000735 [Hymenoscyphus fraxineus]|uniref:Uncharacterized protein n=1 Tax=Hymenoscyphus fraxineus TaxID=746836 RepID=A0A9N9KR64_9HELO|nr:hypothetical protein HYFRA_00000735 [Hymenoscyphus fraxineus]